MKRPGVGGNEKAGEAKNAPEEYALLGQNSRHVQELIMVLNWATS